MTRRPRNAPRRWGSTTVEFSLVAPVLFLMVFASIEFSRAVMLRHTCDIAAAEGARHGILPGATAAECRTRALAELSVLGVRGATATVSPTTLSNTDTEVTVTVSVPIDTNGYIFPRFFIGKSIRSVVTLQREKTGVN